MAEQRSRYAVGVWILVLALTCGAPVTFAQERQVETQTASLGPPEELPVRPLAALVAPAPNAESLFNLRQARLNEHHQPLPIGEMPTRVVPLAVPPPEAATTVSTDVLDLRTLREEPAPALERVEIIANRALNDTEVPPSQLSTVAEPSVAVRGDQILVTGNWFAAFSLDGGANFRFLNPGSMFPSSEHGDFCCDQVAAYDSKRDTMFWLLQYINNTEGNTLRLAVSKDDDIPRESWRYYDFTPQALGGWTNEWFDYPDLVVGNDHLYITSNLFNTTTNSFTRSVLLRIPLEQLANYQALDLRFFTTQDYGGLRATQGAADTVYWAAHRNPAQIDVFTWPGDSESITVTEAVNVEPWSSGQAVAPSPDGREWLQRSDSRMTAAWVSGDLIGFAWTVPQDQRFRFPHVRVVLLDRGSKSVVGQPHIWNDNFAFTYPAAAVDMDGRIGVALHYGGGLLPPSHAVGVLREARNHWTWQLVSTARGTHGPADSKWGDYLTVRPHGQYPRSWVAIGFTLQGGPLRQDIELNYTHFRHQQASELAKGDPRYSVEPGAQ